MPIRHNSSPNPYLKTDAAGYSVAGTRITTATGLDAAAGSGTGRTTAFEIPADGATSFLLPEVDAGSEELRDHSVYVLATTTGQSATLFVQSYNGGTFLSGHGASNPGTGPGQQGSGPGQSAVALTNGSWVRVYRHVTTSTGTTRMRTLIRGAGGGTIQVSLGLVEGETSLAEAGLDDPDGGPGSYFDGDSDNADWDAGTDGTSTLTIPDAPAQVGTATSAFAQSSTVAVTAPSGVQAGDHQLVCVVLATAGETLAGTPAGWTLLATQTMTSSLTGGDTTRAYLFASDPGADPGSASFSQAKTSGTRLWIAARIAYRGGTGITGATFANSTSASTTHTVPSQTTTVDHSVVVGGIVCDQSGALNVFETAFSPPAGWSELLDTSEQTVSGTIEALSVSIAAVEDEVAGTVSGAQFTLASTGPSGLGDDAMLWSVVFGATDTGPEPELETQRLYLTSEPASWRPLTALSFWDSGTPARQAPRLLGSAPAGFAESNSLTETEATAGHQGLVAQWVSDPLAEAGSIGGDFTFVIGRAESDAAADMVFAVGIWVTVGDTNVHRGDVLGGFGATEWPTTTAAAQGIAGATDNTIDYQPGDRIVVEIGYQAGNASPASFTGTLHLGGTGTPDLAVDGTDFSRPAWIELDLSPDAAFDPLPEPPQAAVVQGWGTPIDESDVFDYVEEVPDPTKWGDPYNGPGHAGNGIRTPDALALTGEYLRISGDVAGNQGGIAHEFGQQYGRWEVLARVGYTGETGEDYHAVLIIWPDLEVWPADGEYDWFEIVMGQTGVTAFMHYPHDPIPPGGVQQVRFDKADVDITQWHWWAFEWTPEGLRGFVDGEQWFPATGFAGGGARTTPAPARRDLQTMTSGHLTMQVDMFDPTGTAMRPGFLDVAKVNIYEPPEPDAPELVQASPVTSSGAGATTISATLPSGATAGNILWFIVAGDKDLDGTTPLSGPSGFTRVIYSHTGNVSLLLAYKIATGGETTVSVTTASGNNLSGSDAWVGEYEQAGSDPWTVVADAVSADDGSTPTARSTGASDVISAAPVLSLAAWAIDSTNTEGTATYSGGYVERGNPSSAAPGNAGLWLAELEITTAGGTTESTLTRGGAGITLDQMSGGLVVFARVGEPAAEPQLTSTVTASLALAGAADSPTALETAVAASTLLTASVDTPAELAMTITAAMSLLAEAISPEIALGGPLPHVSFWVVVDPETNQLAPLPHLLDFDVSPIRNGVGSVRMSYPRRGRNYALLRAIVDDDVQLEVEIWVGGTPLGRMRALLMEAEGDDTDEHSVWTFAGHFLECRLRDALLAPNPEPGADWKTFFDNETPGTVIATLMLAAQARGTLTDITIASFTGTHDSNGNPWTGIVNLEIAPHRPYDEVLTDLVDMGVLEWEVTPDHQLRCYEPGSRGVDRTLTNPPVILSSPRGMREARRKYSSRDAGTDLFVAGGDGLYDTAFDATARARFGRQIERADSQNYILDDDALAAYAANKIGVITAGARELTVGLEFGAGHPQPVAGFNIGDWIYIDAGRGDPEHPPFERVRVSQWQLTGTNEELRGTVSVGDLMAERISRLEKLVRGVAGGAVVIGTSLPEPDSKPPAAPAGVSASSLAYIDDQGQGFAAITVSWSPVTVNSDGTALFDLSGYRIRYRYISGGPTGVIDAGRVSSLFETHTFSGVIAGAVVGVSVQAYDRTELESEYSAEFALTTASDAQPPPVPSALVADTWAGIITLHWDGLGAAGEPMPSDFLQAELLASPIADFDPDTDAHEVVGILRGEGTYPWSPPISGAAYYETGWFFKARTRDRSGNVSTPGAESAATPAEVSDGDIAAVNIGKLSTGILTAIMTIAGIIRTSADGDRVEIDDTGLYAYDTAGEIIFRASNGTLEMIGRLISGAGVGEGPTIVIDPTSPPAIRMYPTDAQDRFELIARTTQRPHGVTAAGIELRGLNASGQTNGLSLQAWSTNVWLAQKRLDGTYIGGAVKLQQTGEAFLTNEDDSVRVDVRADNVALFTTGGRLVLTDTGDLSARGQWRTGRGGHGAESAFFLGETFVASGFGGINISYGTTMASILCPIVTVDGELCEWTVTDNLLTGFRVDWSGTAAHWIRFWCFRI